MPQAVHAAASSPLRVPQVAHGQPGSAEVAAVPVEPGTPEVSAGVPGTPLSAGAGAGAGRGSACSADDAEGEAAGEAVGEAVGEAAGEAAGGGAEVAPEGRAEGG